MPQMPQPAARESCNCPPDDCVSDVAQLASGNQDAGNRVVRRFTPLVRAIVSRMLRYRRDDWEDTMQTVFLRLATRAAQFRNECPYCKYVAVVAAGGDRHKSERRRLGKM